MLNPEETIKKTYRFLEVNSEFLPTLLNKKYNPGGSYSNNIITRTIFKPSSAKNDFCEAMDEGYIELYNKKI